MVRRAFGPAFSEDELDDLYSSAWVSTLAAFERQPRELSDEELRRYLFTAVANQASREMRRRGRKPTLPIESATATADPDPGPDEIATRAEQSQITREVLGSLPPRRRAVMVFRYGWGLEPDEVCGIVGDLSPRAYRKEVERGVAEVARKMHMVEEGEWCRSREPILRALAAGTADEEEERQARRHLAHCRACGDFLGRLSGHLHDLGAPLALIGAAEPLPLGQASILDRIADVLERGKREVGDLIARASEAADQAAGALTASGGSGGAGAAGAGTAAKLTGLGAVPKLVAACVGTGAAATACVAAGVVPGVNVDREPSARPALETAERPRERSDLRRHRTLAAINAPPANPPHRSSADAPAPEPPPDPAEPSPAPVTEDAPPTSPAAPAAPSPTTREFEPVGTPVETTAPETTAAPSGAGAGGTPGGEFGP